MKKPAAKKTVSFTDDADQTKSTCSSKHSYDDANENDNSESADDNANSNPWAESEQSSSDDGFLESEDSKSNSDDSLIASEESIIESDESISESSSDSEDDDSVESHIAAVAPYGCKCKWCKMYCKILAFRQLCDCRQCNLIVADYISGCPYCGTVITESVAEATIGDYYGNPYDLTGGEGHTDMELE